MHAYVRLDPVDQIVKRAEVAVPDADTEEVVVAVHDRYFMTAAGAEVTGINPGDRVMVTSTGSGRFPTRSTS